MLAPGVASGFDEINKWMKSKKSCGLQRGSWRWLKMLVLDLGFVRVLCERERERESSCSS